VVPFETRILQREGEKEIILILNAILGVKNGGVDDGTRDNEDILELGSWGWVPVTLLEEMRLCRKPSFHFLIGCQGGHGVISDLL